MAIHFAFRKSVFLDNLATVVTVVTVVIVLVDVLRFLFFFSLLLADAVSSHLYISMHKSYKWWAVRILCVGNLLGVAVYDDHDDHDDGGGDAGSAADGDGISVRILGGIVSLLRS